MVVLWRTRANKGRPGCCEAVIQWVHFIRRRSYFQSGRGWDGWIWATDCSIPLSSWTQRKSSIFKEREKRSLAVSCEAAAPTWSCWSPRYPSEKIFDWRSHLCIYHGTPATLWEVATGRKAAPVFQGECLSFKLFLLRILPNYHQVPAYVCSALLLVHIDISWT